MKKLKYIIFDCDGVLVDSEIIANRIEAEYKTELGFPITIEEHIRQFVGSSLKAPEVQEILRRLPSHYLKTVDARVHEAYLAELKAVSGIPEILNSLTTPVCVASNSLPEWIERKLTITGLAKYFPGAMFSSQSVKYGKPAPDLFFYAAEKMGWNPSECLVVEDSEAGVRAGVAAGMTVVGFLGGAHILPGHSERLLAAGTHFLTSDIREISRFLR
ncbi:MAG: HAD family hydrolase [Bdellovibrionota bacterium]